jgi:hypothetical protein
MSRSPHLLTLRRTGSSSALPSSAPSCMPLSATPEPRPRPRAALALAAALLLVALVLCSSALVPASASALRGPARAVLEEAGAVQLHALRDPAPPGAAGAPGHGAQLLAAQVRATAGLMRRARGEHIAGGAQRF